MKKIILFIILLLIFTSGLSACRAVPLNEAKDKESPVPSTKSNNDGAFINERFAAPSQFERIKGCEASFASYLQSLPLKPYGSKVHTYDGKIKINSSAYEAVVDLDIGKRDLQQCADAIMRLRAEHLYEANLKNEISFKLTNGFEVPYSKWMDGWRVKVDGNETSWTRGSEFEDSYASFRNYMDFIFIYAGTLSLERDLESVSFEDMETGDVLVHGGSPGHAVIVVDMAENPETGEKVFMLAQSYMPAQDIHVLSNLNEKAISPWYSMDFEGKLKTPEWTFDKSDLNRFR